MTLNYNRSSSNGVTSPNNLINSDPQKSALFSDSVALFNIICKARFLWITRWVGLSPESDTGDATGVGFAHGGPLVIQAGAMGAGGRDRTEA